MSESKKGRIIIAEDDAVLRDVLSEKLAKNGYIVEVAEDGIVAIEKIREIKPDCVLMDILMPRRGGIEVLEDMHRDPALRDIPVIIISNSGQPVEIERAQELGAREFLIKAVFDPNEVLEKLERVLGENAPVPRGEWGIRTQNVASSGAEKHHVEPSPTVLEAVKKVASSSSGEKPFILVIEDDKFLRELLVRKLSGEGFDVKNAIEAESAFAILAERKPKMIFCDLILPGVDGFEILKRIKGDPGTADIPVIILSNLGQKEDYEKAMALGAKDFMVKANFTLDEIVAKAKQIVG